MCDGTIDGTDETPTTVPTDTDPVPTPADVSSVANALDIATDVAIIPNRNFLITMLFSLTKYSLILYYSCITKATVYLNLFISF
jgi:hypothetical protein